MLAREPLEGLGLDERELLADVRLVPLARLDLVAITDDAGAFDEVDRSDGLDGAAPEPRDVDVLDCSHRP